MFLKPPRRGHVFIDINIVNVGWHSSSNFLILWHDHLHNRWHDLWGHIKTNSPSCEAISLPFYHNNLKGPEWSVDSDLEVGPSQIEGGNVAPLLSQFLQFLDTNVHVGCIHVYKVIHFSVVHDWSNFPLILLHYCHQRNRSSRWLQLLLGVWHKPAVCYPELQFIFLFTPDMLWNQVLCYFIFQQHGHLATCPIPRFSLYTPALVKSCTEGCVQNVQHHSTINKGGIY